MTLSLVAGGNGYFGALLVDRLRAEGHEVRIFDLIDSPDRRPDTTFFSGDIRDRTRLRPALDGVDHVFNNVAQVPLARDRNLLTSVNVDGTRTLLDAAKAAKVSKVVHTSSSAVFGIPLENPVRPETPPRPVEAYGRAKLAAETVCLDAVGDGLDVTIVRPRTILGHGRLGIFGILFDWIADGADPIVLGRGDNHYQFVHADDLADACLAAAQLAGPDVFNVGADRFGTMREALESLCRHAGTGAKVRSVPAAPAAALMKATAALHLTPFAPYHWTMFGRSMWFDLQHTRSRLQWSPKWSNDEMFADSYDWFLANRSRTEDGRASRHRRSARQGALTVAKFLSRRLPG